MTDGHHDCPERKGDGQRDGENRGQISLLRWKKTLKLHLTSVAITILERGGGRKESVQEMGIMLCDNYWSYRITIANLKTNLGMHSLKGTVHPKIKIVENLLTLRPLLLQNWCGEIEHCITMDPLQMNGCRQNESKQLIKTSQ